MRVAAILHRYAPLLGGAESQVGAIAPRLRESGVDFHVVTRRYPGLARHETIDGVPVHRVLSPRPKALGSISFVVSALTQLRRLEPDVVHAHILLSPALVAVLAKRLLGCAVVATPHGCGSVGDVRALLRRPFGARRLRMLQAEVDRFTVIAAPVDAELEQAGIPAVKRSALANAVDTELFRPMSKARRLRGRRELAAEQGLDEHAASQEPWVLFAGRLAPEKCVERLFEAWKGVLDVHPRARLLLAGDGPCERELRAAAPARAHFLGRRSDLPRLLPLCDVMALPSAIEACPMIVLEAQASGVAVVATHVGGTPQLISHGETGMLYPAADTDSLTSHLARVLGQPDLRRRLTTAGLGQVRRQHSLDAIAPRWLEIYRQLGSRSAPLGAALPNAIP